jgi:hypothetical protein
VSKPPISTTVLAPAPTVAQLRRNLPAIERLVIATLDEALHILGTADYGRFVFDPQGLRDSEFVRVANVLRTTHLDVLIYTELAGLDRVRRVTTSFPVELLLMGTDDERVLLPKLIATSSRPTVPSLVRHRIGTRIAMLPHVLGAPVHGLFAWAPVPESVAAFASQTGRSVRTVNRWLLDAQLISASGLLVMANVARAYHWLGGSDASIAAALDRDGRIKEGALWAQCVRYVGLPPRRAVCELDPDEFASRLVARLLR